MKQKDRELLLKDLCCRLPYGVKISIPDLWTQKREIEILDEIFKGDDGLYRVNSKGQCIEHIKPYLLPLSSMTKEQTEEFNSITQKCNTYIGKSIQLSDFCNKHHIDWRGLIPMGLALDATNLGIYE